MRVDKSTLPKSSLFHFYQLHRSLLSTLYYRKVANLECVSRLQTSVEFRFKRYSFPRKFVFVQTIQEFLVLGIDLIHNSVNGILDLFFVINILYFISSVLFIPWCTSDSYIFNIICIIHFFSTVCILHS